MRLRITINGRVYEADVEVLEADSPAGVPRAAATGVGAPAAGGIASGPPVAVPHDVSADREVPVEAAVPLATGPGGGPRPCEVRAQLPGVVSELRVRPGQRVAAGDVLLVLEAMKMDNDVMAPVAGTVRAVHVAPGEQVAAEQVLVVLE